MQKRKESSSLSSDDSYQEYLRNKNKKYQKHGKKRSRSRSKNRSNRHNRHNNHQSPRNEKSSSKYEFGKRTKEQQAPEVINNNTENQPEIEKEKPEFSPSGILAEYSNKINGTVLKFTEPVDAAMPDGSWRLYPFKSDEALEVINLSGQSSFLVGKDPSVSDILMQNPTVSGQHAVIQFRKKQKIDFRRQEFDELVFPYIMDLLSTNGTILNGEKIEPQRYIELRNKDILKFGFSSRDYVLMQVFQ